MVTAGIETASVTPFSKKNTMIRIFCISGWLAVPIIPDKWSSAVLLFHAAHMVT
jgi:hypothetical protein